MKFDRNGFVDVSEAVDSFGDCIDREGKRHYTAFNDDGNEIKIPFVFGRHEFIPAEKVMIEKDPLGRSVYMTYDLFGNLVYTRNLGGDYCVLNSKELVTYSYPENQPALLMRKVYRPHAGSLDDGVINADALKWSQVGEYSERLLVEESSMPTRSEDALHSIVRHMDFTFGPSLFTYLIRDHLRLVRARAGVNFGLVTKGQPFIQNAEAQKAYSRLVLHFWKFHRTTVCNQVGASRMPTGFEGVIDDRHVSKEVQGLYIYRKYVMEELIEELLAFFEAYRKPPAGCRPIDMDMRETWRLYNREHVGMGGGSDYPHNAHIDELVKRLQDLTS